MLFIYLGVHTVFAEDTHHAYVYIIRHHTNYASYNYVIGGIKSGKMYYVK